MTNSLTESDEAVYQQFLAVLRSSDQVTIPRETFYGAITHFISTLSAPKIHDFMIALRDSPSSGIDTEATEQAVSLGITSKLEKEDKGKGRWFPGWKEGREKEKWIEAVCKSLLDSRASPLPKSETLLRAVLLGMSQAGYKGKTREQVEEAVILNLVEKLEPVDGDLGDGVVLYIADVMDLIDPDTLRALDPNVSLQSLCTKGRIAKSSFADNDTPDPRVSHYFAHQYYRVRQRLFCQECCSCL